MNWLNNLRKFLKLKNNLKTEEEKICKDIDELNRKITIYYNILNQKSIWLFVSTLGISTIPLSPLASHRLVAASLLFVAFSWMINQREDSRKESFPKQIKRIKLRITSSNLDQKTKESISYKLNNVKARITGVSAYKNTWVFTICSFYYVICYCFFADAVLVSIQNRVLESLQ